MCVCVYSSVDVCYGYVGPKSIVCMCGTSMVHDEFSPMQKDVLTVILDGRMWGIEAIVKSKVNEMNACMCVLILYGESEENNKMK